MSAGRWVRVLAICLLLRGSGQAAAEPRFNYVAGDHTFSVSFHCSPRSRPNYDSGVLLLELHDDSGLYLDVSQIPRGQVHAFWKSLLRSPRKGYQQSQLLFYGRPALLSWCYWKDSSSPIYESLNTPDLNRRRMSSPQLFTELTVVDHTRLFCLSSSLSGGSLKTMWQQAKTLRQGFKFLRDP